MEAGGATEQNFLGVGSRVLTPDLQCAIVAHHLRPDLDKHDVQVCLCWSSRNHKTRVKALPRLQMKAGLKDEGGWKEVGGKKGTTGPDSALESSCLCFKFYSPPCLLSLSQNRRPGSS